MNDRERIFNRQETKTLRAKLRRDATVPEKRFWQAVRGKQLGFKFRRQHGIGRYIVDFYCPERKLVIELDGASHFSEEARQYDAKRDAYIQELGIRVLRFNNIDIMQNLEGVLQAVLSALAERSPTPTLP